MKDALPRIHTREALCRAAERALNASIDSALADLTTAEKLRVVNSVLCGYVAGVAKFAIRVERHGNEEKPGGVE